MNTTPSIVAASVDRVLPELQEGTARLSRGGPELLLADRLRLVRYGDHDPSGTNLPLVLWICERSDTDVRWQVQASVTVTSDGRRQAEPIVLPDLVGQEVAVERIGRVDFTDFDASGFRGRVRFVDVHFTETVPPS